MALDASFLSQQKPAASPQRSASFCIERAREVIDIEIEGLYQLKHHLDEQFVKVVEAIETCEGRIIVTGMGKSGLIGKKIAATLSSTGTPAYFMHPSEGSHGDLGMILAQDLVLALSNSGETPEILNILPALNQLGATLVALTGRKESTLARHSQLVINTAVPQEACSLGLAPTSSTTATLVLGDALSMVLLDRRGFSRQDFARFHPAGALGKRLLVHVYDLMHTEKALPLISKNAGFTEALLEISEKKLGLALVTEADGQLAGLLTDGDIRRAIMRFSDLNAIQVSEAMTINPKVISSQAMAIEALQQMETFKITALVCCNEKHKPIGIIHLHDLLNAGIV
jgi:arabinose-5-phosphate isomerase